MKYAQLTAPLENSSTNQTREPPSSGSLGYHSQEPSLCPTMSSDIPSLLELTENIDALESTHSADPATSMVLKKIFGSDILINFEDMFPFFSGL